MTNATSKKTIAASVYAALSTTGATRKEIMFEMMERAGLTAPGAATYFNNFKKAIWSLERAGVVTPTAAPVIDYAAMSSKELVAIYNARATKPVAKFRDHATAVRRVTELMTA